MYIIIIPLYLIFLSFDTFLIIREMFQTLFERIKCILRAFRIIFYEFFSRHYHLFYLFIIVYLFICLFIYCLLHCCLLLDFLYSVLHHAVRVNPMTLSIENSEIVYVEFIFYGTNTRTLYRLQHSVRCEKFYLFQRDCRANCDRSIFHNF